MKNDDGEEVGKSVRIGKKAVFQTALTRYIMPITPILGPILTF